MTGKPRVLVVDDVRLVLTSLRRALERAGFEVEATESGADAIRALERGGFDIVLTDFTMPAMNGVELLRVVAAVGVVVEEDRISRIEGDGLEVVAFRSRVRGSRRTQEPERS